MGREVDTLSDCSYFLKKFAGSSWAENRQAQNRVQTAEGQKERFREGEHSSECFFFAFAYCGTAKT